VIGLEAVEKELTDGSLPMEHIEKSYQMIMSVKKSKIKRPDPIPLAEAARIVGHPEHLALSKAIATGQIPEGLTT
jgi:hypothetical protein